MSKKLIASPVAERSYLDHLVSAYQSLEDAAGWLNGSGAMESPPVENALFAIAREIVNTLIANEDLPLK